MHIMQENSPVLLKFFSCSLYFRWPYRWDITS